VIIGALVTDRADWRTQAAPGVFRAVLRPRLVHASSKDRLLREPHPCIGLNDDIDFVRRQCQAAQVEFGQRVKGIDGEAQPQLLVCQVVV
jgi:hypothetical protein